MSRKYIDIHNYDRKLERELQTLKESEISEKNKKTLLKFNDDLFLRDVTKPRIVKEIGTMRRVAAELKKDFEKVTEEDLRKFITEIKTRNYSVYTVNDFKKIIKRFYKWLEGNNEFFPQKVAFIKSNIKKKEMPKITREELITENEAHKLVDKAENARDKALASLIWDTGARIGEIGSMLIGSISFNDNGTMVHLKGKTGSRDVWVIESTAHLVRWKALHPDKDNPNAPFWVNLGQDGKYKNKPLGYRAFYKLFERLFYNAGVKKKFNPHLFRHSRATWCAINNWTSLEMSKFFGWEGDSKMPAVYTSLVAEDITNRMKESYGIETKKKIGVEERKPKTCVRCETLNDSKDRFCYKCGMVLDPRAAMELEKAREIESELHKQIYAKKIKPIEGIEDIRELIYQAVKNDKELVKQLQKLV